jgi:hypothetical protein
MMNWRAKGRFSAVILLTIWVLIMSGPATVISARENSGLTAQIFATGMADGGL